MFDKILWATDGSESADRALQYAKVLAQKFDAELIMVHSAEYVITSPGAEPAYAEEEEHLLLGSVTQRLLHLAPCPVVAVPPARA